MRSSKETKYRIDRAKYNERKKNSAKIDDN